MGKQTPATHSRVGITRAEWLQMFPERAARPGAGGDASYTRIDGRGGREITSIDRSLLLCGDARELLRLLPSDSVQTVVTSPPYWSLRDYDTDGQIGRDDSLSEYVASIVGAFGELKRVLRDDGTVWLNVGDAFTSGNRRYRAPDRKNRARAMSVRPPTPEGLKPKDLIGLPWRLAFGLQDAGWWLRSEVIWHKPNAHPESVRDRPTKAHETLFLLSKSQNYHYDVHAVQGPNGRRLRTVWDIPTEPGQCLNGQAGDHPAPMPLSLARRCLMLTGSENGVVLDPYAGSGTTLLAARELGRRWVGIELNPAFVDLIEHRMGADGPG
ncbi:MAG: site-specific DNA-methyltransferase [Chloroflexota bacterium]|nr:site-specific DNA-methyltransferase [Chloroflexota bacterium]